MTRVYVTCNCYNAGSNSRKNDFSLGIRSNCSYTCKQVEYKPAVRSPNKLVVQLRAINKVSHCYCMVLGCNHQNKRIDYLLFSP
jgi:hypothetical protein